MSDEATSKSGKTWFYVVGLLLGLPVCYWLSFGPVTVLALRGWLPSSTDRFLLSAYAPLVKFAEFTGTTPVLHTYQTTWLKMTGTPIPF